MRAARKVLERLEESLRGALEGVGRLLPGRLQPLELAAELTRAMDRSTTVGPEGTFVANRYRLLLAAEDLELLGGLAGELEQEFARDLQEHAAENGYVCGPRVRVSLEADSGLTPGRTQVHASFDREPAPAQLTITGGLPRESFRIGGEAILGRSTQCEVSLDEAAISRRHARLRWTYAGYVLEDLGSSNGTYLNGAPISQALLNEGDVIEIGLVQLRFGYLTD